MSLVAWRFYERAMHITIVSMGDRPVPPPLYGGSQRVVYWLGKALLELGHQVTLIAHRDSHIPGAELRPLPDPNATDDSWMRLIPDATDILHLPHKLQARAPKPFLMTLHGNGKPGQKFHPNTVFVSRSHAANHGSVHFVHNGLDPADYEFNARREDYAVFLAKASWDVKNLKGAIAICRRAGVELHVLGSRDWPLHLHRFLPAIRGVRYHGMLGGKAKLELLAKARCLIFPVRWQEPFGVAVTEALVSGCYVTATPYGSLPEIITPRTGILSNRSADHVQAVSDPTPFKPADCRERVLRGGFTHLDMARKYVSYYEKILTTGRLGAADEPSPETAPGFEANDLLPWES